MAAFPTNRGIRRMIAVYFQGATAPANFYLALVKASPAPTPDTVLFSELAEIAAGNGYTSGGISVARNSTDFDTLDEDTVNDQVLIVLKDIVWTATGGAIPASGDGARYAVLLGPNATVGDREVFQVWDLDGERAVSVGQALTLRDLGIRGSVVV